MDEEIIILEEETDTIEEIEILEEDGSFSIDRTRHNDLSGRNEADQHEITAITGLQEKLNQIEALKTVESNMLQQADYYMWQDGNAGKESRNGLFVSLYSYIPDAETGVRAGTGNICLCNGINDVFGVTVESAGFVGNQAYTELKNGTKVGRDYKYSLVAHSGLVEVQREASVAVGDYVVPNQYGQAKKSDGQCGYLVTALKEDDYHKYAVISLAAPSTIAQKVSDTLYNEKDGLVVRMDAADANIISIGNRANDAYYLAQMAISGGGTGGSGNGNIIEDLQIGLDKLDKEIDNITDVVNRGSAMSEEAKELAEGAASRVREVESATNEALAQAYDQVDGVASSIEALTQDLEPLAAWPNADNPTGIAGFVAKANADSATLGGLVTWQGETNESIAGFKQEVKENYATQAMVSKVGENLAAFEQEVTDNYATQEMLASFDGTTNKSIAEIKQRADENGAQIEAVVANIDKYSVGEYSQSYRLTWEQAKSILKEGMVHIPTKDHSETYEGYEAVHKLSDDTPSDTQTFLRGYHYTWDGEQWEPSKRVAVGFSPYYMNGTEGAYWVVTENSLARSSDFSRPCIIIEDWSEDNKDKNCVYYAENSKLFWYNKESTWISTSDGVIYDFGGLYLYTEGTWVKVASVADNTLARAVSSIKQTTNEISASVSDVVGNMALIKGRVSNTETDITNITKWQGETTEKVSIIEQKTNDNEASIGLVVAEKDGAKVVNAASIIGAVNKDGSSLKFNADKIAFTATDYAAIADNIEVSADNITIEGYVKFEDLETEGKTTIHGGNIQTDSLSAISADLGTVKSGCIQSPNYDSSIIIWGEDNTSSDTSSGSSSDIASVGLIYELNTEQTEYRVTGIGTYTGSHLRIPSVYNDKPVTSIKNNAFSNCSNLISVIISDNITNIGDSAFASCKNLVNVTFGNNSQLASIGKNAFYYCNLLTSITIPNNVANIGNQAFAECNNLKEIIIPEGVTNIGSGAFWRCWSLIIYCKAENKPSGWSNNWNNSNRPVYWYREKAPITEGNYWHYNTNSGFKISCNDANMIDSEYFKVTQDGHITATAGEIGGCTIKDGQLKAESLSLLSNTLGIVTAGRIQSANYGQSHQIIEWKIDIDDTSESNDEPSSVETTVSQTDEEEMTPSWDASEYLVFKYDSTAQAYQVSDFEDPSGTDLYQVVIPAEYDDGTNGEHPVTSIGSYALGASDYLVSVVIPKSIKKIGFAAFIGCPRLSNIEIPDSVTDLTSDVFYECDGLKSVTIGKGVTSIGKSTFYHCDSLTSITIPDSVTSIGYEAFASCSSLTSITIPASVTSIGGGAFSDCSSLTSITIPDGVTSIGQYTFKNCSELTGIIIPDNVINIQTQAFAQCSKLCNIIIGKSVTQIDDNAFEDCTDLFDIYNKSSLSIIVGDQTNGAIALNAQNVYIVDNNSDNLYIDEQLCFVYVTNNSEKILIRCISEQEEMTISEDIKKISRYAFYFNLSVKKIIIPNSSQRTVGQTAFNNNQKVYYSGSKTEWLDIADSEEVGGTVYYYSQVEPDLNTDNTDYEDHYWYYSDQNEFCLSGNSEDDYLIDSRFFQVGFDGKINAVAGKIGGLTIDDEGIIGKSLGIDSFYLTPEGLSFINNNSQLKVGGVTLQCNEEGSPTLTTTQPFSIQASNQTAINFMPQDTKTSINATFNLMVYRGDATSGGCQIYIESSDKLFYPVTFTFTITEYGMNIYGYTRTDKEPTIISLTIEAGSQQSNFYNYKQSYSYFTIQYGTSCSEYIEYKAVQLKTVFQGFATRNQSQSNNNISITGNLIPSVTATSSDATDGYLLGNSEAFWSAVYAKTASIITSDRNQKNSIELLSNSYDMVFDQLVPVSYKFNVNNNNRTHTGFIAQDVKQAIENAGLTTQDFAAYCEWENKDGSIGCGLRYEEFIALCVDQIQKLKKRVKELEDKSSTTQND